MFAEFSHLVYKAPRVEVRLEFSKRDVLFKKKQNYTFSRLSKSVMMCPFV